MAQREMGHAFVVEFKRLAYEAVKRGAAEAKPERGPQADQGAT
jgi:hypothetical protein